MPVPLYHGAATPPVTRLTTARQKIQEASRLTRQLADLLTSASQDVTEFQSTRLAHLGRTAEQLSIHLNLIARRAQ
jgi:hypothetical protein